MARPQYRCSDGGKDGGVSSGSGQLPFPHRCFLKEKTPGSFPPGAVVQANFTLIRRSGIEVAVHAKLNHQRALIDDIPRASRCCLRTVAKVGDHTAQARFELLVDNVDTEIGAGVDVELRAGTDGPHIEAVVAGNAGGLAKRTASEFSPAQVGVGVGVVGGLSISAIDRRLPRLAPEVLVSGVDAPRGRQLDAGPVSGTGPSKDAIAADTDAVVTAVEQRVHVAIREVDVLPGAFGVVDLRLEVIALADRRRQDLDAGTDRPADLIAGMACGVGAGKGGGHACAG